MSRFLIINVALPRDESIDPSDYKTTGNEVLSALPIDYIPDMLWPHSQQVGGGFGGGGRILNPDFQAQAWEINVLATGSRHRMVFTGVTLNAAGTPLGGCTVQLFNTATGQLVDTQVSDSKGNYKVTDPNNVACFMVAYLPGSPDVTGATIDELTGT